MNVPECDYETSVFQENNRELTPSVFMSLLHEVVQTQVLQMFLTQCWVQIKDNLLQPAGNALPNAARDATGLLCHKGMLLVDVQLDALLDPESFSTNLLSSLQPRMMPGIIPAQLKDFSFSFVELQGTPVVPFLQTIKISE